jgi:hypothetical protein
MTREVNTTDNGGDHDATSSGGDGGSSGDGDSRGDNSGDDNSSVPRQTWGRTR